MNETHVHDLIVVGLGAVGAAVTYHAAAAGLDVLGIDQHHPPHHMGSSHAETRVTRLAVGEGPQYLPFVARSHEIWRELEARTGIPLFHECGGFIVTLAAESKDGRWGDFVLETDAVAKEAGIEFQVLEPASVRAERPHLRIRDNERVGFESTAGIVMVEHAIAAQLAAAEEDGASLSLGEKVVAIQPTLTGAASSDGPPSGAQARVETDAGQHWARRVVVATGPWFSDLAPEVDRASVSVTRQVVCWFEVDDLEVFSTDNFSFMIWAGATIDDYLGVFPTPPNGTQALKVLGEQFHETTSPDSVERTASAEEIADLHRRLVAPRLAGVSDRCVKAEICLYTNTPDDHFLIDTDPENEQVLYMSPCSGHGFKHSAGLGEVVASWAASGEIDISLDPFRRRSS